MTQTSSASERCQRCGKGTMLTDNDTGEMFCSKCGFVATERVEQEGPEWRSFSKDDGQDRTRTGTPTSLAMHDMGLATIINPINKDATGKPLSATSCNIFSLYVNPICNICKCSWSFCISTSCI